MKKHKLHSLPDYRVDPGEVIDKFSSETEKSINAAMSNYTGERSPEGLELIKKTRDLTESCYACGYLDAVASVVSAMRRYADRFEVKMSGMSQEDLEEAIKDEIEYPLPSMMEEPDTGSDFLKPFFYSS